MNNELIKYADLHIHTKFSDGTFTPKEVFKLAQERGLACIAITDHDTVGALAPSEKFAEQFGIELIPGVELSAEQDDYEVHILGYFIDWKKEWFQQKLNELHQVRESRALAILEKLKQQGIDLNPQQLLRQAKPGTVGRLHIARLLEKGGFVSSQQEAFNKYLGNHRPCNVKKFKLKPAEAIQMITRLNGLAVLAHPYSIGNDALIGELAKLGLRGIEAYYPEQNQAAAEHYRSLAKQQGLLITGGSDCHGLGKDRILMGEAKVPYSVVEELKKEAAALRNEAS